MSSVINNNQNENVQAVAAPPGGEKVLSKGELFSTSLGVMTMTASQMLESFGVQTQNSSNATDDATFQDDLITQMMLDDQTKRLEKGERMEEALIRALGTELVDPKKGTKTEGAPNSKQTNASTGKKAASNLKKTNTSDGNKYTGKNAIFQAAGLVSELQKNSQDSLVQQLQNEIQVMEAQLEALERIEEFMAKFQAAYDAYKADPKNEAKWQALLGILKEYYKNDPNMMKKLDQLDKDHKTAVDKQNNWDKKSGFEKAWDSFWGADNGEHYAMQIFNAELLPICLQAEMSVCGDPGTYEDLVTNGLQSFSDRIQAIMTQMNQLLIILSILQGGSGGKSAIFQAEALIESLMETAIKNNAKKNQDETDMANMNIKIQSTSYDKAQDALKKLEQSESGSHGVFGWIEDFFTSCYDAIKNIVVDIGTGNLEGLYNDTVGGVIDKFIDLQKKLNEAVKEAMKTGDWSGVLDAAVNMAVFIVEAAVFTAIFGPEGIVLFALLQNTSFGQDMENVSSLVVDAVVAYESIYFAGLLELVNLCDGGKLTDVVNSLVDQAKTYGEAILSNPALKAVADIAMIVTIIASVLTQQYWLAGIMLVLLVANDVTVGGKSLMQQLTENVIAPLIEKIPGVSKETAQWIADAIVIVAVMIATVGVGGFAAGGEEAVDDSVEMVDMAADGAANTASNAVEEGQTIQQKAMELLQKAWDTFKSGASKAAKSQAGTAVMAGGMMMGATNFAGDFAKDIAKNNKDLQLFLEILIEVLTVIATIGGGVAAFSGGGVSGINQKITSLLKNLLPDLEENAGTYANLGKQLQTAGMAVQGATNMAMSGDMIIVGLIMKELKQLEGIITLMKSADDLNQQALKSNQSDLKKLTQENIQFVKNMDAPALASLGNARALEQLA